MRLPKRAPAAVVAAAFLVLVFAPVAAVASPSHTSESLYLAADGTLTAEPGPSPQSCLALSATSPASVSQTFVGSAGNGTLSFPQQTALISLALDEGATAGSGFTLEASLDVGGQSYRAAKSYGAGAAVESPVLLTVPIASTANTTGAVELALALTKSGAGPIAAGQTVSVLCDHAESRIHPLSYEHPAELPVSPDPGPEEPASGTYSIPAILGIAALAGLVTLAAGAVVLSGRSVSQRRIHFLLGATAGLLLTIAILDLVPEALEAAPAAPLTIAIALLVLFLVRHFAGDHSHGHSHAEAHQDPGHKQHVGTHHVGLALIAFFALGFHRFIDGLVLPAAFEAGNTIGFAAASAVLIHQFPDGIAAASLFLAAGWPRRRVLAGVAVMAALTPVGSLVGLLVLGQDALVGHLIALAAATFIFIALAELIPELRAREQRMPVGIGFAVGYAVAFAIVLIPGFFGLHI